MLINVRFYYISYCTNIWATLMLKQTSMNYIPSLVLCAAGMLVTSFDLIFLFGHKVSIAFLS